MATATKDVSLNKKVSQFFWRSWAIQASFSEIVKKHWTSTGKCGILISIKKYVCGYAYERFL